MSFGLLAAGGCLFSDHDHPTPTYQECETDEDCADLDDGDPCYAPPRCVQLTCNREFLQNATDCQCDYPGHCSDFGLAEQGCNRINCFSHQCSEEIMPAGPSIDQIEGDCLRIECD